MYSVTFAFVLVPHILEYLANGLLIHVAQSSEAYSRMWGKQIKNIKCITNKPAPNSALYEKNV